MIPLTARTFLMESKATAAVEMALMLPLLLTLMFSALEGAHYLYTEHQVVKGVRDGARFAARKSFDFNTCSWTDSSTETAVSNVTRTGSVAGGTPRISTWAEDDVTIQPLDCSTLPATGIYAGALGAVHVEISATVPYPSLFGTLSGIDLGLSLHASQQAAVTGV